MKKVLVFENEIALVKGIFDLFNIVMAKNAIDFKFLTSSQDLDPLEKVLDFDFIFVDLSLSERSEIDGTTLIDKIVALDNHPGIAVITGRSNPEEILQKKNLDSIPIIKKPIQKDSHFQLMYDLIFAS